MGSLIRRRIERLEHQRAVQEPLASEAGSEEDAATIKERWLAAGKARRHRENYNPDEWHVRDVIKFLLSRGEFAREAVTLEEFRGRLRAWRPPLEEGAIDRVSARMAYQGELAKLAASTWVCPRAWRESFEAADELQKRCLAVPSEVLAEIFIAVHDLKQGDGDDHVEEWFAAELERWGITEELHRRAVGPDSEEIPEEERRRRIREVLAEVYYGEKGFYVQQHITRLMNQERSVE